MRCFGHVHPGGDLETEPRHDGRTWSVRELGSHQCPAGKVRTSLLRLAAETELSGIRGVCLLCVCVINSNVTLFITKY